MGRRPASMVRNTHTGTVDVHTATGVVTFDGEPISADAVSLSRRYFL
jgi:hypothetical protein